MKNKLLLVLNFLFASAMLFAQPTITSGILPVKGDTVILALDTILQPPGNSGVNVTWNFSSLQQHILSSRIYLDPASTPYAAKYPNAVLARTDGAGSVYTYWKNAGNISTYYGFVEPAVYDQNYNSLPVNYYKFPIKYGDAYVDSLFATTNPGNTQGSGKYYFSADGWGTLILPNKVVQNVLRTKSILYIGDSTVNSFSLTKEYAWYSPNQKDALLVISSVLLNGALYKKFVFYDKRVANGVSTIDASEEMNIYPNPTSGVFKVHVGNIQCHCIIGCYDPTGRLLMNKEMDERDAEIDLAGYGKGVYVVKIKKSDTQIIKKVIIQ